MSAGEAVGAGIGVLGIVLAIVAAIFFLWLGLLSLRLSFELVKSMFSTEGDRNDPDAAENFMREMEHSGRSINISTGNVVDDPYGTGGSDVDDSEWRYKVSGGYEGEYMEDIYGGKD